MTIPLPISLKWYSFGDLRRISIKEDALLDVVLAGDSNTANFCVPDGSKIDDYDYRLESDKKHIFTIDFFEEDHKLSSVSFQGSPNSAEAFQIIRK